MYLGTSLHDKARPDDEDAGILRPLDRVEEQHGAVDVLDAT